MGAAEELFYDDGEILYERKRPFPPDADKVDRGEWYRAAGACVCETCGYEYRQHSYVIGFRWLRRLCNGDLVKL